MTSRGESFCGQSGRGLHAETAPSALRASFRLVVGGLTNILLVVLGIVNLQLQGLLLAFPCGQFTELWQLMSWPQSGHHASHFSTWCFSIYKTAHRTWLRILSVAPEKELKVLGYA